MKIKNKTSDRKQLVKALEIATDMKAQYLGPPSFGYQVGPYVVNRCGEIEVDDELVSEDVIGALAAKYLIESEEPEGETTIISQPLVLHDGRSLRNLIFILYSKSRLLSKAVGKPGFYSVSEELIKTLQKEEPKTVKEMQEILADMDTGELKGLTFDNEKMNFHYPYTLVTERLQTYMQLSELMTKMALTQKWIRPERGKSTNEKYSFRGFLIRLGMLGDEYKTARKILLKNLKGNMAFRTKNQEEAAKEKLKKQRKEAAERAAELAFEAL